jgi:hypothetical protein
MGSILNGLKGTSFRSNGSGGFSRVDGVIDVIGSAGNFGSFGLDPSLFGGDLGGLGDSIADLDQESQPEETTAPDEQPKAPLTVNQINDLVKERDAAYAEVNNNPNLTTAEANTAKQGITGALLTTAGIPFDPDTLDPFSLSDGSGPISNRWEVIEGSAAPSGGGASAAGAIASILDSIGGGGGNSGGDTVAEPTPAAQPPASDVIATPVPMPIIDPIESWVYSAAGDVFTSNTTGEALPADGSQDIPLNDGGTYTILSNSTGTSGTAEHTVVDEAGQPVGNLTGNGGGFSVAPTASTGSTGGLDTIGVPSAPSPVNTPVQAPTGSTGGGVALEDIVVNTSSDVNTPVQFPTNNTAGTNGTGNGSGDGKDGTDGRDGVDGSSPSITQTLFGSDLISLTPISGNITEARRFAPRRRRSTLFGER